jgi:cytochrome c556
MRTAMAALSLMFLASCGGPQTSQANNAQANISNDSRDENVAQPSATNAMVMLAVRPLSGAAAAKVMHERHEGMETIGKNAKAINRELGGSAPDLATVRTSAATIANLARKSSGWFAAGTGPEAGKTGAKPEIWQNQQDFAAKVAAFQKAAAAFDNAAHGNDVTVIKARFADLGGTCKACHDKYRAEMHH